MTRKKKTLLLTISLLVLLVVGLLIFILNYTSAIYETNSADGDIMVRVEYAESDILRSFGIGTMGGYDYRLTVKKRVGIFYDTIKTEEFYFNNDGAPLSARGISVEWTEQTVKIHIESAESNDKIFTIGVL